MYDSSHLGANGSDNDQDSIQSWAMLRGFYVSGSSFRSIAGYGERGMTNMPKAFCTSILDCPCLLTPRNCLLKETLSASKLLDATS